MWNSCTSNFIKFTNKNCHTACTIVSKGESRSKFECRFDDIILKDFSNSAFYFHFWQPFSFYWTCYTILEVKTKNGVPPPFLSLTRNCGSIWQIYSDSSSEGPFDKAKSFTVSWFYNVWLFRLLITLSSCSFMFTHLPFN